MNRKLQVFASMLISLALLAGCEKDENNPAPAEPDWVTQFTEIDLQSESFWNGSDNSGGFQSGPLFFPNLFNPEWHSWSGFSVSNITDNQTPGWGNQYSAFTGSGYNGNSNYAVIYVSEFDQTNKIIVENDGEPRVIAGMFVTNNTYAALAMRDGDDFSKKFGGESGDDPDWFKLEIIGVNGEDILENQTIEFYLADYRFQDNSQNYIIDTWEWIDLSTLGEVHEVLFRLSSSDLGDWGMNTPGYFCIGQVEVQ